MPKTKKRDSSSESESDSGSQSDEKAPPPKKAKPAKNADGEYSWHLENKRFIKVSEFKGKVLVDIREYYEKDGDLKPGKKGICLSASQWRKLTSFAREIDDAIKEI